MANVSFNYFLNVISSPSTFETNVSSLKQGWQTVDTHHHHHQAPAPLPIHVVFLQRLFLHFNLEFRLALKRRKSCQVQTPTVNSCQLVHWRRARVGESERKRKTKARPITRSAANAMARTRTGGRTDERFRKFCHATLSSSV